jgi:hypothetical protein
MMDLGGWGRKPLGLFKVVSQNLHIGTEETHDRLTVIVAGLGIDI